MTIEEAIGAVDGQASRDKDAKYSDGSVRQRVKLADKVRHDGINYDVTFRFDSTGRLDQVVFFSNKVKKESFDEVVKVFLELYGPPTSDSTKTGPASYSAGPETVRTLSWKKEGANLYATSAEQQLGPFVKGRLISIAMTYTRD